MTESRVIDVESEHLPGPAPTTSTRSSSRAWSSGRQLTEAQRQRKRAVNNATRRTRRRQRTADQILLLELELQKLRAKSLDGDDDDEDRADAARADGSAGSETEGEGSGQAPVVNPVTTRSDPAVLPCSEPSTQALMTSTTDMVPHPGTASSDTTWACKNVSCDVNVLDAGSSLDNSAQVSLPYLMREPAGRDSTEALNACVDRTLFSNVSSYSVDEDLYQSILAYGVLYGWDTSIEIHATYCPLLRTIRFLDECFMYDVGPLNRLSIVYVVFKQLQHRRLAQKVQVTNIWSFFRSRPAQTKLAHDHVIDYLVWPGMRERFVLEKFPLGNAFWASLFRNFHFYWPGDSSRALQPSRTKGLLVFSEEYLQRLSDLSHWTFNVGFFHDFPMLADDVLPTCSIPRSLALWATAAKMEHLKEQPENELEQNAETQFHDIPA